MSITHGETPSRAIECGITPEATSHAADMPGSGVQACAWLSRDKMREIVKAIRRDAAVSRAWLAEYKAGNPLAGEVLLRAHDPIVHKVARKWCRPEWRDWDDVLQQGRMGVLTGAEKYDPAKGAPSTYLTIWIRNHITRWLMDRGAVVRIPVHRYDIKRGGRERASVWRPHVRMFSECANETLERENDLEFEDTLVADGVLAEDALSDAELADVMPSIATWFLTRLTPIQHDVLKRRHAEPPETLIEIGKTYGVSRERIRQIEGEAFGIAREKAVRAGFNPAAFGTFDGWLAEAANVLFGRRRSDGEAA